MSNMDLMAQDVLVALRLAIRPAAPYADLARELGLSASQVHAAVQRAVAAGLVSEQTRAAKAPALLEFLVHGLKYTLPPKKGPLARGIPTAHSAPPLCELISNASSPLVWPDPEGSVRGETLEPIHKAVPGAAQRDPELYECLALVDALRAGRARERQLAERLLRKRLLDAQG